MDLDLVEPATEDNGHDPDEVVAVREALQALTPHDRMVLLLRFERAARTTRAWGAP